MLIKTNFLYIEKMYTLVQENCQKLYNLQRLSIS